MVYVKFICNTPYCGTESISYQKFKEKDEKLFNEICKELAGENGGGYEYFVNEDDLDWYYDECYANSYWEIITEEEFHEEGW